MSQNPFKSFDDAYLASLNNAYRAAEVKTPSATIIPEGKYQCVISAFALKPSRNYPDELNLSLGFEVLDGPQKGKTVFKYYMIIPEGLDILKTDMSCLGINLEDDITRLGELSTAEAILDQVVDITIKHKKKQKGEGVYQNIYINRCLGKIAVGDNSFQEVDDDELPFD